MIVVDAQTGERTFLYHHCDGYPEGVGRDLSEMLEGFRKEFEGRRLDICKGVCPCEVEVGETRRKLV